MSNCIQASVLDYWLGQTQKDPMPTLERLRLWFGHIPGVEDDIKLKFFDVLCNAIRGKYKSWNASARGSLALIIIFDQLNRHMNIGSSSAYAYDERAQSICLAGLNLEINHELDLIERAFFYFPLLHAENIDLQDQSVDLYAQLLSVSMQEARPLYENFYQFAVFHRNMIHKFGRFPHRNEVLGRKSTIAELRFLTQSNS